MNRPGVYVQAYNIDRRHCDHKECAKLREVRAQCARAGRWDLVNQAERALSHCAPKGYVS